MRIMKLKFPLIARPSPITQILFKNSMRTVPIANYNYKVYSNTLMEEGNGRVMREAITAFVDIILQFHP